MVTSTADPASKLNLTYSFGTTNNNGNVLSTSSTIDTEVRNQSFTYDPLNRIDTAKEAKSGVTQWSQSFDYDQYGNRCLRVNSSTACVPEIKPANNNRLNAFSYDPAGNQLNDENHTYTYDAENRIRSVEGEAAYVYDGEGNRVRKLLGANLVMVYSISGELLAEFTAPGPANAILEKEYIYGVNGLAATIATDEITFVKDANGKWYPNPAHYDIGDEVKACRAAESGGAESCP